MRIVASVAAMQRLAQKWRRAGQRIVLVPTMGWLHEGHLSLVRRARKIAGPRGKVVVSIYVNPTQFGLREDFSTYPRDLKRDLKLCRAEGVDAAFAPGDAEMYPRPPGAEFSTLVAEEKLSRTMEGASRPAHFRGVTTVVAKLFNIVPPDAAVFGAKDFQQAAIVRRMARDLNFPAKIVVAPTVREPDGLAMSSRNRYLSGDLRRQATVLWRAIRRAQDTVKEAGMIPAVKLKANLKRFIGQEPDARLDHVEFFEPDTLDPVARVTAGTRMALAVFIGKTRLIDNARI
ncbi:MAG: pantoate--beta-alanine ligase [Verrucomicrobiota bacterium]|nr:pantoate--beta-alanine ligase [Verrucomicrobiota bacterium]